jgi:hypothetical protein
MNRSVGTAVFSFLLIASASKEVWAIDGPPGRGGKMGPPPEAIEACNGKTEGDAVEFTTPRGDKVKAICRQMDGQLVAVPEGDFRGPKAPPPGGPQNGQ